MTHAQMKERRNLTKLAFALIRSHIVKKHLSDVKKELSELSNKQRRFFFSYCGKSLWIYNGSLENIATSRILLQGEKIPGRDKLLKRKNTSL